MDCIDLSERGITVERKLVTCADVALKGGRAGERAAERPARIRKLQCAEVNRSAALPQEWRLLDQLAVIPGRARLEGEPGRDARHARSFEATHAVVTPVEDHAETEETASTSIDLYVVPVLLIDGAVPLDAPVHPHRLPAEFIVGKAVGCEGQGRYPAAVLSGLRGIAQCQRRRKDICWERCPVKAARTEALRPRVIQQRILGGLPAQVRAAPEAGKGPVK